MPKTISSETFNKASTGDKLRILAEVIEQEPYNQARWVFRECGSPSCLAGHATALSGRYDVRRDQHGDHYLYAKGNNVDVLRWDIHAAKVLGMKSVPKVESTEIDEFGEPEDVYLFAGSAIVTPDLLNALADEANNGALWVAK